MKNPFCFKKLYPEKIKQMKTLVKQGEPMWKKTHKVRRIIGN